MKSGSNKPGADVKRGPFEYHDPTPTIPAPTLPWMLIIIGALLLGALVLFGLFVAFMGADDTGSVLGAPAAPAAPAPVLPPPPSPRGTPARVTVTVSTTIVDGQLYVDEQDYGPLPGSERLDLPAGPHVLELRVGGQPTVRQVVNLRVGPPVDIVLAMSDGSEAAAPDPTERERQAVEGAANGDE